MLQLAEVKVFSKGQNLAMKGTSKHSSQYLDADAKRANDGRTEGDYDKGSVSHTSGKEKNPWWEVDLGTQHAIDKIVVWNRTDGDTGKGEAAYPDAVSKGTFQGA